MKVIELSPGQMLSQEYLYLAFDNKDADACVDEFRKKYPEFSQRVAVAWYRNGRLYVPADINRDWRGR